MSKPRFSSHRSKTPNAKSASARKSLPDGLFLVEGSAAIREYFKFKPDAVQRVCVKERQAAVVRKELAEFQIRYEIVAENDTTTHDRVQLGTPVWAYVNHALVEWTEFERRVLASKHVSDSVLALDHISDPRNLGAIVRSAAFFGVKHVIVPERRQVLLTQSSVGTAQGGFALTDVVVVVNLARALEELKEMGYWVLGTVMDGESPDAVRGRYEKQVIVLGSEDKGISPNVLSRCDVRLGISGAPNTLDSLNVSVAAGIMLQRLIVLP